MVGSSKDNKGEGRGKEPDGRRTNSPPEHGKIQPGEVRNPHGRRGKPQSDPPTRIDEIYLREARRVVSRDADGDIDGLTRLVQEEWHAALTRDVQTRIRVLAEVRAAEERVEREMRANAGWIVQRRLELRDEFYFAKKAKRAAPDILPHPDHVRVSGFNIEFVGPIDAPGRELWERLKSSIAIAACLHELARETHRINPTPDTRHELQALEAHRRKLMRCVPKDWNWREDIFCRDSQSVFTAQTIKSLRSIGYVPSSFGD